MRLVTIDYMLSLDVSMFESASYISGQYSFLCPFVNQSLPLRPRSPDVSSTVVIVAETSVTA